MEIELHNLFPITPINGSFHVCFMSVFADHLLWSYCSLSLLSVNGYGFAVCKVYIHGALTTPSCLWSHHFTLYSIWMPPLPSGVVQAALGNSFRGCLMANSMKTVLLRTRYDCVLFCYLDVISSIFACDLFDLYYSGLEAKWQHTNRNNGYMFRISKCRISFANTENVSWYLSSSQHHHIGLVLFLSSVLLA